jgi:translation initiation factor 2 subunit 1
MYKNELPKPGDIVMCRIFEIQDIGSYVHLLEYNNIVGMIGVTEYSKQRIRSISKLVNIGKYVVAEVINVDERTKNIDLSKKTVTGEEINECESRYERNKKVYSIVRRYAELFKEEKGGDVDDIMLEVYEKLIWGVEDPYEYCKSIGRKVEPCTDELFLECCASAFQQKSVVITGHLYMCCFGPEGIDAIKEVLISVKKKYPDVRIVYSSNSIYTFTTETIERRMGSDVVNMAMEEAIKMIKVFEGGDGVIKERAVSNLDANRTFEQQMKLREMNKVEDEIEQ